MSVNNSSPKSLEEVESPRKRMRLDNSMRKSWSLMDRKTDHEVLQEMGVSLLEPDDSEPQSDSTLYHKTVKRKHNLENVNPNVIQSPRKSPRKAVPTPSTSKSSPLSSKPLTETNLDNTIVTECILDEETPVGQSVAADYLPAALCARQSYTPLTSPCAASRRAHWEPAGEDAFGSLSDEVMLSVFRWLPKRTLAHCMLLSLTSPCAASRRAHWEPAGEDAFGSLSDEVMLSVFRWLPKRTLAHCMLLCKRWYRVACDETLWQRLDLGNKTLSKDALGRILARKPIIVRLASSEIGEWRPTTPPEPSRIQYLDLSMATIDVGTLNHLLVRCPLLKKLSLESVQLDDTTCEIIGKCTQLETLNVTMSQGITPEGLAHILRGCLNLQSLNISWCNLSETSLQVLVSQVPTRLQRLNLAGARLMTDEMVSTLCERAPRLVELDLSDCARLSGGAARAASALPRLEHLALSRCYLLPAAALAKLSGTVSLQYLEAWGMLQASSLAALRAALPAIQINQYMFSAIARPTVGTRRTSIWGLRTRD